MRELVIGVHGQKANDDRSVSASMTKLFERDIELLVSGLPAKNRKSTRKKVGLALLAAVNLIQNRVVFQETSPLEFEISDRELKQEVPKMVIAYLSVPMHNTGLVKG